MGIVIRPGEKASIEWRERKARRKRGTKAKAKFAAADADFIAFREAAIREEEGVSVRAGKLYAAYLQWFEKREENISPPMSMRAFGIRIRRHYTITKGQGGVVTYEGIACNL